MAADNGDAAISAVLSTDTRVLANRAYGGRFGVFVSASSGGRVAGNLVPTTASGLLALDVGSGPSDELDITANAFPHNTKACAANEDSPELSRVGVALFGGAQNRVVGNLIIGNVPAPSAPTAISAGVVSSPGPPGPPRSKPRSPATPSSATTPTSSGTRRARARFCARIGARGAARSPSAESSVPPDRNATA